jgi:uncharacterized protein (DUF362 family)/Pyruvate/2-oxoacid:ferredoxin oxidoreductase delta subunit
MSIVSITACDTYDLDVVRRAVRAALSPLGGIGRFVRPGMRVLLKPNLLSAANPDRGITTHPAVVRAVAEQAREAGGTVLIGDSPAGPIDDNPEVWRETGMAGVAAGSGASLVLFEEVTWKTLAGADYFLARPVFEVDLVVNLPKLKTHLFTLLSGAVKNLFGVVPGTRKREAHCRAPGVREFSPLLVDVLELVQPALTILDGVLGLEGYGPGAAGTPRRYGLLAASADPVALDAVVARAMGCRPGQVLHVAQAGDRGLGVSDPGAVEVVGEPRALDFGRVSLPAAHWFLRVPSWVGPLARRMIRVRPQLAASECTACGRCVEACPRRAITLATVPEFDDAVCTACLCCAEVCPVGAITPRRNLPARWIGLGF